MAVKTQRARRTVTRKPKASAQPEGVVTKLREVSAKMLEIQKEEEAALVALLKEIEAITRDTMNVENEIRRQSLLKGTFEGERRSLRKELQDLARQNRVSDNERKQAEQERQELVEQNSRLKSQLSSLESDVKSLQKENTALSVELERLQSTNDKLKTDVQRLSELRQEYLKSISEFKEVREGLLP
jgi:chromosome segregation ATPase